MNKRKVLIIDDSDEERMEAAERSRARPTGTKCLSGAHCYNMRDLT